MAIKVIFKSTQPQAKRVVIHCKDMTDASLAIRQAEPRKTVSA
jgi:hypothetical protein